MRILILACTTVLLVSTAGSSRATAADPTDEILAQARASFYERRFAEAEATLRWAVELRPGRLEARYLLVRTLLRQQRVEAALEAAEAALAAAPGAAPGHVAAGDVHFRMASFEAAEHHYRLALAADDRTARAHLGLGKLFESERRLRSATYHYRRAYALAPGDPDALIAQARTLPASPAAEALVLEYLEAASYEEPEHLSGFRAALELGKMVGAHNLCRLAGPAAATTFKLSTVALRNGPPIGAGVPLRVNGGRSQQMLLDTGASGILIARATAERHGIAPIAATAVLGLGDAGPRQATWGWVRYLDIGGVVFRDCLAKVVERAYWPAGDGILGADVFSDFLITLNFRQKRVQLEPLPTLPDSIREDPLGYERLVDPSREGFVPVRIFAKDLMIAAELGAGDKDAAVDGLFELDTGASQSFVSQQLAQRVTTLQPTRKQIQGISGQPRRVMQARRVVLSFAGRHHQGRNMLALDFATKNRLTGVEVGGLIGFDVLGRLSLTIDYRNALIKLSD